MKNGSTYAVMCAELWESYRELEEIFAVKLFMNNGKVKHCYSVLTNNAYKTHIHSDMHTTFTGFPSQQCNGAYSRAMYDMQCRL